MGSKTIIINSMLNVNPYSANLKECYSLEWIRNRIKIFREFTLKSLKLQTNQDYNFFLCYDDSTDEIVQAELNRYDQLPSNIHVVMKSKYLFEMLKYLQGYEYVYFVRMDSDDAYHKTYIQQLHDYRPKQGTVTLINRSGYLYDSINKEIGKCYCKVVTFYTFIYRVQDFLSGRIFNPNFADIDTEQYIALRVPHEFIEKRNYLWHIHNSNCITTFGSWFTQIDDATKDPEIIKNIISEYIETE